MGFTVEQHEYVFTDQRPFASCHASTLVVLPNEDILVAWFGGTKEGAPDVAIWCSARRQGTWSEPVKVADEESIPLWNPVLFLNCAGTVHLYYKVGKTITTWKTYVITSQDEGRTWDTPKLLVDNDESGGRGPVKNKPILLQDGTWAAPASFEDKTWNAFVDLSYDKGRTWERSQWVPVRRADSTSTTEKSDGHGEVVSPVPSPFLIGKGIIQPTLWESEPGIVHMLLRSSGGFIYRSDSQDNGKTWSEAAPTSLPNNNSGIDLTTMNDGTLILVYNPVEESWGPRTPLTLTLSRDNGHTWTDFLVLEDSPGEYSYPAIVSSNHHIYVTYTWKRERVAYWKILMQKADNH